MSPPQMVVETELGRPSTPVTLYSMPVWMTASDLLGSCPLKINIAYADSSLFFLVKSLAWSDLTLSCFCLSCLSHISFGNNPRTGIKTSNLSLLMNELSGMESKPGIYFGFQTSIDMLARMITNLSLSYAPSSKTAIITAGKKKPWTCALKDGGGLCRLKDRESRTSFSACILSKHPCTRLRRVSVLDPMPVKHSLSQFDHNSITTVTPRSLSTPIECLNRQQHCRRLICSITGRIYAVHVLRHEIQSALLLLASDSIGNRMFMT
ncbi:uncharacterized protein BKA55DRAFT_33466 [Fusarium redolens]|uniref:Uncharacterized protein n=1 Tax=Fusarium redolens TaxID=48865 RepID=A0A9P9KX83_FUSRE|nr:uncharacterized protein BKA55DRAFT_33466 [Fusarium redolens]KAH7270102.1 hypothetical protein BKA55DRAFT_33466 [Fusarium redolens]